MNAIIIENEPGSVKALQGILKHYCPEVSVLEVGHTVEEGISLIDSQKPEIVFLDIRLEPGTGFDILDRISFVDFKLIMTTQITAYAQQAINHKVKPVAYLSKPIQITELIATIQGISALRVKPNTLRQKKRFFNGIRRSRINLILNDILFFFLNKELKLVCARMVTGEFHYIDSSLLDLEQVLEQDGFHRINRSEIVNLLHVKTIRPKKNGGTIHLSNQQSLDVSTKRYRSLKRRLAAP